MLFSALPHEDLDTIAAFIEHHAVYLDREDEIKISTSMKNILHYWSFNKRNLYRIFGNKFVLKKHVSYMPDSEEKIAMMERALHQNKDMINFKDKFFELISNRAELNHCRYDLCGLMTSHALVNNVYPDRTVNIFFPGETKPYKVVHGMKAIKALQRIAKTYGLDEYFEKFRLAHSMIYNGAAFYGNLCLSIHPLDYMSMSVNNSDWTSCMSWPDGCHSLGTVEMMNSDCVIVAYLEAEKPYTWSHYGKNYTCANKKWRELFIVTDDVITEVKSYPFRNKNLTKQCLDWIKDLYCATNPDIAFYPDHIEYHDECLYFTNGKVDLHYECGFMYNDFGAQDQHYCYLNQEHIYGDITTWNRFDNTPIKNSIYINYSGPATCVCCGKEYDGDYYDESLAERVICPECSGSEYCENCGNWVTGEDMYQVDGMQMCECCYNDRTGTDSFTGEIHLLDNMETYALVAHETEIIPLRSYSYVVNVYNPDNLDWSKYLTDVNGQKYLPQEYMNWFDNEIRTRNIPIIDISTIKPEAKEEISYNLGLNDSDWEEIIKVFK